LPARTVLPFVVLVAGRDGDENVVGTCNVQSRPRRARRHA
jgi:hypothetical protein